jgi:hypothetical protein
MPSLETLHVIHCGTIRHIIVLGQGHLDDGVLFTELTNIQLHDLPVLEQISKFKMIAPCLETIKIWGCWSLRRLPHVRHYSSRPAVEVEKDVWDALEWDGVAVSHHPSLYREPMHSRYYKRRMLRRTVLRYAHVASLSFILSSKGCYVKCYVSIIYFFISHDLKQADNYKIHRGH